MERIIEQLDIVNDSNGSFEVYLVKAQGKVGF